MSIAKATAIVRIIAIKTGKPLTKAENFNMDVKLAPGIEYPIHVKKAVCEEEVREKFAESFRERLKKDHPLRNAIGGIKWSVDLLDLNVA